MAIFDGNLPYTNFHELNLDWIIEKVKECIESNAVLKERVDNMEEYIRENLPAIASEVIAQMVEDGTLAITLETNYDVASEYLTIELRGE